jgi:hypothetical protein
MRRLTPTQKLAKGRDIARKRVVSIDASLTPRTLAAQMGVGLQRVVSMLTDLGEKSRCV